MRPDVLELKTAPGLLAALHEAQARKQTSQEILEQRVSFVYGSLDDDNGVTRDRVRQILTEQNGN